LVLRLFRLVGAEIAFLLRAPEVAYGCSVDKPVVPGGAVSMLLAIDTRFLNQPGSGGLVSMLA